MNKITAVGRWELHQGYAERRYEIYQRVKRGWILLEKGWLRKGSRFQFLGIPPKGERVFFIPR